MRFLRLFAAVLALVGFASVGQAQTYHDALGTLVPGVTQIGALSAGSVTFTPGTSSTSVNLPGDPSRYPSLTVENTGAQDVYVNNGSTAAISGGTYIRAGETKCMSVGGPFTGGQATFSGITAASTTTVWVTQANSCAVSGGGGGGGGGLGGIVGGTTTVTGTCPSGQFIYNNSGVVGCSATGTTIALPQAVSGATSGGVPYFSNTTTMDTSALLTLNALMLGGGAGAAPKTTTTGAGVVTAVGLAANANGGMALVNGAQVNGHCLVWGSTGVTDSGVVGCSASVPGSSGQVLTSGGSGAWGTPFSLGTGVQTALGVNVGSAGAPVLYNGAGGQPSAIDLTHGTSLPISTGVSGLGTGVAAGAAQATNAASGFPTLVGTFTSGHALKWDASSGISDAGAAPITGVTLNTTCPNSTQGPSATLTLSGGFNPSYQSSTSYAFNATTDACKWTILTGAGGTFTLPTSASTPAAVAGTTFYIQDNGSGSFTVTPSGYTINGSSSAFAVGANNATYTFSYDGTNYVASVGASSGGSGTVNSGTSGQLTYYASTGTAVSGATTGTGILSALGTNTGSTGSVVLYNGNLGTPTAGSATNLTNVQAGALVSLGSGIPALTTAANSGSGALVTEGAALAANNSMYWSSSGLKDAGKDNMGYVSGRWYVGTSSLNGPTASAFTANRIRCFPEKIVSPGITASALSIEIGTQDLSGSMTMAVYASDGTDGTPGTLLTQTVVATPSPTNNNWTGGTISSPALIPPGSVWACWTSNTATAQFYYTTTVGQEGFMMGGATAYELVNGSASNQRGSIYCTAGTTSGCGSAWGGSGASGTFTWPNPITVGTWANWSASQYSSRVSFQAQ